MEEAAKSPALGFSIQIQIDPSRQIVAQTHLDRDASLEEINDLFDKVMMASDRQAARYKLEELHKHFAEHEEGYDRLVKNLELVDQQAQSAWETGKRRGPVQLSAKERADRANAEANVKHWQAVKERIIKEIDACEDKLYPRVSREGRKALKDAA